MIRCICKRKRIGTWGQGVTVSWSHQVGKPGQKQQLTHTQLTKDDTHFVSFTTAWEEHGILLTYFSCTDTHQLQLSVLPTHFALFFCFASVCLGSCGTALLKSHVVLTPCPLILCDRCILSLSGAEFELFIKAHESIKSHGAVGHRHMDAFYPYVESCQERSQHQ